MLTQAYVASVFEYREGRLYWRHSGRGHYLARAAGTLNADGYRSIMVDGYRHKEHRLVFLLHKGYMPKHVDHINGVRDDNRIENLREATASQNAYNSQLPKNNTSGVKCVNWSKRKGKWEVRIRTPTGRMFLGYYDDLELAAFIAEEARDKYHKQFARNE